MLTTLVAAGNTAWDILVKPGSEVFGGQPPIPDPTLAQSVAETTQQAKVTGEAISGIWDVLKTLGEIVKSIFLFATDSGARITAMNGIFRIAFLVMLIGFLLYMWRIPLYKTLIKWGGTAVFVIGVIKIAFTI